MLKVVYKVKKSDPYKDARDWKKSKIGKKPKIQEEETFDPKYKRAKSDYEEAV
jgi:hypothetical protein